MKKIMILFAILAAGIGPGYAQNILVLEKADSKKSFKYREGDKIELRTRDSVAYKGLVTAVKDTVIVVNFSQEVRIANIAQITRPRWLVSIASKVLLIGGAGLIVVQALNGMLSEAGGMSETVLYSGVAAVAVGALMIPFDKSRYVIAPGKWKLKILEVEKEFKYQKNKPINF